MKKKRAVVADGGTVVRLAERRFHQLLHHMVVASRIGDNGTLETDVRQDKICVAGWEDQSVRWLVRALQAGPYHTDGDCIDSVMLNDDVTAVESTDARYVLVCLEMTDTGLSSEGLRGLYMAVKLLLSPQVRVCCALVGTEDDYKGALHKVFQEYPELRWLSHKQLITMVNLNINYADQRIDGYTREGLRNWLIQKPPSLKSDHDDVMDYVDICRIVSRELRLYLPEVVTLLRLLLMCVAGCVWVLATVILLIAITRETGYEKDLTAARESLSSRIARMRTGKAEWGWRSNAAALTALQLQDRSWCFQNLENQRSVDRMEIGLLAAISRSRSTLSREITLMQLASHVNSLLVTYQNPRDFYGHDLVAALENHVVQKVPFVKHNIFAHSFAVISLYNAGVQIERRHVDRLIAKQREDGSFVHGVDECAVVALAFAAGSHEADLELAMRKAVSYIVSQRRADASYGSVYATALTLQALNASRTILSPRDHDKTVTWLLNRVDRDPALRTVEVTSQVLIALSGKTLLGARFFSARPPEKNALALRNPVPIYVRVDDTEGDTVTNGSNDNSANSDDTRHLLEDHVDTRTRDLNASRRKEEEATTENRREADTETKEEQSKESEDDAGDLNHDGEILL